MRLFFLHYVCCVGAQLMASEQGKEVNEASCGLFPFQECLNKMDGITQAVRKRSSLCGVAQEPASNVVK